MNCYLHPEVEASAFCRECGRPLCTACQRAGEGTVFCPEHAPRASYSGTQSAAASNPYDPAGSAAATAVHTSPGLAFVLGWIPGVGAIYNGQYLKGLFHVVILGLLISLVNSAENSFAQPLMALILTAFVFYMPFEAYHTAKKRQMGIRVDEWSSLMPQRSYGGRLPVGPVVLICIGVLFLLHSLRIIRVEEIQRFWPVLLIFIGVYMLYNRLSPPPSIPPPPAAPENPTAARPNGSIVEVHHEQ